MQRIFGLDILIFSLLDVFNCRTIVGLEMEQVLSVQIYLDINFLLRKNNASDFFSRLSSFSCDLWKYIGHGASLVNIQTSLESLQESAA